MRELINGYTRGREMVIKRIHELKTLMDELRKNGGEEQIAELNLEQRISLLMLEQRQTQETIDYLTSYIRRVEARGTENILF